MQHCWAVTQGMSWRCCVQMQDEIDSSDWGWLRQLGDVFELWSEDEERQELQPRLSASRPSAASVVGISVRH